MDVSLLQAGMIVENIYNGNMMGGHEIDGTIRTTGKTLDRHGERLVQVEYRLVGQNTSRAMLSWEFPEEWTVCLL